MKEVFYVCLDYAASTRILLLLLKEVILDLPGYGNIPVLCSSIQCTNICTNVFLKMTYPKVCKESFKMSSLYIDKHRTDIH